MFIDQKKSFHYSQKVNKICLFRDTFTLNQQKGIYDNHYFIHLTMNTANMTGSFVFIEFPIE